MFCMSPDFKSEWKKMGNGPSFIRKEITTNRIGTLEYPFINQYKNQSENEKLLKLKLLIYVET